MLSAAAAECAATDPSGALTDHQITRGSGAGAAACGMECGVAASGFPAPAPRAHPALSPTERSPAKAGLHVNFSDKGEVRDTLNCFRRQKRL